MAKRVSTLEVRQRLGDMLNRVALRSDEYIIERRGKPLAALVPVERIEQMRRLARTEILEFLDRRRGRDLTEEEAQVLADEAKHETRLERGRAE
ncbi:MAG: type II toxin-antitoxin system Phd/YefM family antitoxin [Gemmatimonadota bacterium]